MSGRSPVAWAAIMHTLLHAAVAAVHHHQDLWGTSLFGRCSHLELFFELGALVAEIVERWWWGRSSLTQSQRHLLMMLRSLHVNISCVGLWNAECQ